MRSGGRRQHPSAGSAIRSMMLASLMFLCGSAQAFLAPSLSARPIRVFVPRQTATSTRRLSMMDVNDLWNGYMGLIDTHPLITKSLTSGVIVPLGDMSAQAIETYKAKKAALAEGKEAEDASIDWKRVLRFMIFGATLQGPWNHFYFQAYDALIPPPANPFSLINVGKVAIDQGIQAPIFTVVIFSYLDFLEGKNWEEAKAQIKRDLWPCLKTNWVVWIPATFCNYAFIPSDLRVLYVNIVFLGWCVFLSLLVNRKDEGPSSQTLPSEL